MREMFYTGWGQQKVFVRNENATVKLLEIKSNKSLSLQKHMLRSEQFYIVKGTCTVVIGTWEKDAVEGDMFYIPVYAEHTVKAGPMGVVILEVVTDVHLESDIQRLLPNPDQQNQTCKTGGCKHGTI